MYAVSRPSPYDSLPSYKKLQETIGFATKIFDECHLNFYANTQIDLQSSISHNIYLSATYMRSDPQGKKIFNLVFPPERRFGEQQVKKYSTVLNIDFLYIQLLIEKFQDNKVTYTLYMKNIC